MVINKFVRRGVDFLREARKDKSLQEAAREDDGTGNGVSYQTSAELEAKMRQFQIRAVAVLIDGTTDISALVNLPSIVIVGCFSFNLDLLDTEINGHRVQPVLPGTVVKTDGWIVSCTNELAALSLNQYLMEEGQEHQYVLHHVKYPNGTRYYSYVDFFSGDQTTNVYINNYYQRCYHIPFPLDLKLTLRNSTGKIVHTRQIIIAPDALRVITSADYPFQSFVGYLEVEFEIAKKVMPFLHYLVDYISPDFVSSNHQSGLGLHPPNTEFNRGYIPTHDGESLVVCLFQRNYATPVRAVAILKYLDQHDTPVVVEKEFEPIHQNQMLYQDITEMFPEVDFSATRAPCVVVRSDVPLHRPNYYYTRRGKPGYYDVSHAARDPLKVLSDEGCLELGALSEPERQALAKYGCVGMDLRLFLFPTEYEIDTLLALGNDTTAEIKSFNISVYDHFGQLRGAFEREFDYDRERYLNLSDLIRDAGLPRIYGTVALRPASNAAKVPLQLNGIAAYRHKQSKYLSSTAASGAQPDNIPFYFRGGPPSYLLEDSPVGVTEIFARGVSNNAYDTFFALTYPSANIFLKKEVRYEICIVNQYGEKRSLYRTLAAHGSDFLVLSELIAETSHRSTGGNYTIWFCAVGAHLYGKHFLFRKRDSAIAVEHCYVGKYGM